MKKYSRANLNEVANTYKKMILEDYSQERSITQRRPAWNPITGPGATPFIPPKPKPKPVVPEDLEDLPFDLSPDLPDRPDVYRAPGTKPPMRLPALKPGTPGGVGGVLGRAVWPALLGYYLGTFVDDVVINPRPAKPTPNQLRPVPTEILPSPESLYPRPSQPTLPSGRASGGRPSGGGSSSGGGMGGM